MLTGPVGASSLSELSTAKAAFARAPRVASLHRGTRASRQRHESTAYRRSRPAAVVPFELCATDVDLALAAILR